MRTARLTFSTLSRLRTRRDRASIRVTVGHRILNLLKRIMEPMNIATKRTLDLKDPSSLEYDPLDVIGWAM